VGKVRKTLPKEQQTTVRKGKDGYERDTKNIGKVQVLPDVGKLCDYLAASIDAERKSTAEIDLTILCPPTRGPGFEIMLSVARAHGRWHVGHRVRHYVPNGGGENIHPCKSDDHHAAWTHAIRHHLMSRTLDVLRHQKAHRKLIRFIEETAQQLEHLEAAWAAGDRKGKANKPAAETEPEYPNDEPEELTVEDTASTAGASAGERSTPKPDEDLYKETPPIMDDTIAAKRVVRVRELLAERLVKGKPQCGAGDRQLVSLALVVGVPVGADDEPWSDDLPARCWGLLADRLRLEVADRLDRGETAKLPPLDQLAGWWAIDIRALAIQAERAVKG
jgi:hypothetical protein